LRLGENTSCKLVQSMQRILILDKLIVTQLLKKFPPSMEPEGIWYIWARHWITIVFQINPDPIRTRHFLKIHINIILPTRSTTSN
jgi:hypothetical protein